MIIMRPVDCALITNQLFTSFAIINEGVVMMNTITEIELKKYAEGGGVGIIEERSD